MRLRKVGTLPKSMVLDKGKLNDIIPKLTSP